MLIEYSQAAEASNPALEAGDPAMEASVPAAVASDPAATAEKPAATFRIDILTLFPEMFAGPFDASIIARAQVAGLVQIAIHNLRDWTSDRHRTTDDYAYGGGGGMVLMAEPIFSAVGDLLGMKPLGAGIRGSVMPGIGSPSAGVLGTGTPGAEASGAGSLSVDPPGASSTGEPPQPVVLMTPQGRRLDHTLAAELATHDRLVVICGHYEGVDERVREHLVTYEVSVGDFVVTGGELPAMLLTDAVVRLRPGVLGLESAAAADSFADAGLLEHPHYTRPADFRGWLVPEILLSGHHAEIARWRRRESLRRTLERRPDRLAEAELTDGERLWLAGMTLETG